MVSIVTSPFSFLILLMWALSLFFLMNLAKVLPTLFIFTKSVCACSLSRVWLLQSCGLYPTRLLCPWDSPGKNTKVGCHVLLQGIFLTQGSNLCLLHLLHWQVDSLVQSHLGSPIFSKNQLLFSFIFSIFSSLFHLFLSHLYCFPSTNFGFCSFSSCFSCKFRLFIWDFPCFLM